MWKMSLNEMAERVSRGVLWEESKKLLGEKKKGKRKVSENEIFIPEGGRGLS